MKAVMRETLDEEDGEKREEMKEKEEGGGV